MDAVSILDRLREVGVTVRPDGDELVLKPGARIPPDLYGPIKANKPQIMDILRGSNPPVVDASPEWHAHEVARRVIEEGVCVFWSDLFGEMVAFVRDDALASRAPSGVAVYTMGEIEMLFPEGGKKVETSTLRLTHEAKKLAGARVISVVDRRQGNGSADR